MWQSFFAEKTAKRPASGLLVCKEVVVLNNPEMKGLKYLIERGGLPHLRLEVMRAMAFVILKDYKIRRLSREEIYVTCVGFSLNLF
jgi:hypothetical protein